METKKASERTVKHNFWDYQAYVSGFEAYREKNSLSEYFEPIELYRGQPDDSPIVASVFRDLNTPIMLENDRVRWLLKKEYTNVCGWFSRANKAGFSFGFDIHPYINWDEKTLEEFIGVRPGIEKHFGALSLSRHYGCQNRLIDFTKDGRAALYFAATSAFDKIEKHLLSNLNSNWEIAEEKRNQTRNWLENNFASVWMILKGKKFNNSAVINTDYGNNKFAHAQSALFIMAPEKVDDRITTTSLVFSQNLEAFGFRLKDKVYFPYRSIPNIILDMERFGFNMVRYYPNPSNIFQNEIFLERVKRVHNLLLHI
jgi:hypothetical protein